MPGSKVCSFLVILWVMADTQVFPYQTNEYLFLAFFSFLWLVGSPKKPQTQKSVAFHISAFCPWHFNRIPMLNAYPPRQFCRCFWFFILLHWPVHNYFYPQPTNSDSLLVCHAELQDHAWSYSYRYPKMLVLFSYFAWLTVHIFSSVISYPFEGTQPILIKDYSMFIIVPILIGRLRRSNVSVS